MNGTPNGGRMEYYLIRRIIACNNYSGLRWAIEPTRAHTCAPPWRAVSFEPEPMLVSLDLDLGNWSLGLIVGLGAWVRPEAGLVLFRLPPFPRQQARWNDTSSVWRGKANVADTWWSPHRERTLTHSVSQYVRPGSASPALVTACNARRLQPRNDASHHGWLTSAVDWA